MLDFAKTQKFPLLPLRDIVVFPGMAAPLFVGRPKSIVALESVLREDRPIVLVTQRDPKLENPGPKDLYSVGTLANVLQILKLPDGTVKVLVEGISRVFLKKIVEGPDYFEVTVKEVKEIPPTEEEGVALTRILLHELETYAKMNKRISEEMLVSLRSVEMPARLADTLAAYMGIKISAKQELLEMLNVALRMETIYNLMLTEMEAMGLEHRIRSRVKRQMEKSQREYYLNEQMKAIQSELGDNGDGKNEFDLIAERIQKTKLSKEARERALAELKKLRTTPPMSAESTVIRNYLDWLLGIPWKKPTKIIKDLEYAETVLNQEHYGLEKVKERILEALAVQLRVGHVKGPIICLVGPPGVGKTSLGKSIAKAMGRNFIRVALGGVRDESEIRGHRRTYIGALPGKIIQNMKKAKSTNPLFLLDEVDKLGSDWRGDPASSLLEVLDPEQNAAFNDHYLEVDYDLSDVMFVTTANSLNIPGPLLDRMEVIRIAGYTEDEKREIAKGHLIQKQMDEAGLKAGEFSLSDDALVDIIRYYTREAGVRSLERCLSKLARKSVRLLMNTKEKAIKISSENLEEFLGVRKYRYGEIETADLVGITNGLAWTEVGGEILLVEAVKLPGSGKMIITGKLGDVMQESIQAAASYVKSRAEEFGISKDVFEKTDFHVHVPEGAIPKDGPSAGVVMVTSLVSILTGIPVRRDMAMTGEISLRGRVLPIGGLKEKLLAARRSGIKTVAIPVDNLKDLSEIPDTIKGGLDIHAVSHADEVLNLALVRTPFGKILDKEPSPKATPMPEEASAVTH